MADPRDPGKSAGDDVKDAAEDPTRTPVRSERFGADTREGESSTFGAEGEQRSGGGAGLGNLRGRLGEMNREAGGVGGGLAHMTSEGGCLRRLLPIILIVVVIVVVLIIFGVMG